MIRSLYSAISGLKNHQIRMDVIGNNTANVNTIGFKRSRVSFATELSQTLKGASAPSPAQGGTNAMQVGMGMRIGSIDQIMTQGSSQTTGKATDMMLQGSGFYVLNNHGQQVYTRAGGFGLDSDGTLVDPATGAKVQGFSWGGDDTTPVNWNAIGDIRFGIGEPHPLDGSYTLTDYSIDQSGVITGVYSNGVDSITHKIAQIAVATFANDAGLQNVGGNFYMTSNNSGMPNIGAAGEDGRASIIPNSIEMSNVDLSTEFTDMIVTQRGFQANSRVITVSDTLLEELINLKR